MNQRSDTDRLLRHWMADGPSTMPDRVVDVIADRISRQPQRRTWRLPWRITMNPVFKYGIAVAAVLLIAVVGYNLLPRTTSFGGPGPGPSSAPTPAASATPAATRPASPTPAALSCDNETRGCLGPLAAGTYSSANFKPTVTYTIPAGSGSSAPAVRWSNTLDLSRAYTLMPPSGGFTFQVISEIAIPEQTADCTGKEKAGAGSTVADWVKFVTRHPGLDAQAPAPVTIGGFSGSSVRFARASSWKATCPGSIGPAIELFLHPGVEDPGVRIVDDQQETFTFLDVRGETVLIIVESGPTAAQHTADLATAQPIIDTLRFTPR